MREADPRGESSPGTSGVSYHRWLALAYTGFNIMPSITLSPGVASLVQHVELSTAGWQGRACRQLILATLWFSGKPLGSSAIRDELVADFSVPLLPQKVNAELRLLSEEGSIVQTPAGAWKLSEEKQRACDNEVAEAEAISESAFERFAALLDECCMHVDAKRTWERFNESFLLPLVRAIGAQTYELVSGEDGGLEWIAILDSFVGAFPRDTQAGLRLAIGRFLDPSDREVRSYVLRYLNAFFYLEALRLSQSAFDALTSEGPPEFKVFLDTNFIFSMLDLHDNPANEAAESLKLLLQHQGGSISAEMFVLPITLNEAKRVLTMAESSLRDLRLPPNLANAGTRIGVSGIALRFIEENVKQGGSLHATTYFEPYLGDLIGCLRREGVEIYNEDTGRYCTRQDVVDDVFAELEYEKTHHDFNPKRYPQVEHDMVLWHFVRDKRPAALESPANAGFWAITVDYRLLGFDHRRRAQEVGSVPVCLHPTNFVQMLQFWVARSEELDRALLGSMQLPFLFRDFDQEAERVTLKILAALGRYSDAEMLPEDTVTAVMLNRALRERIADQEDPVEEQSLVRAAIVEENARISQDLQAMAERVAKLEADVAAGESDRTRHQEESREQDAVLQSKDTAIEKLREEESCLRKRLAAIEYSRFVARWCVMPPLMLAAGSCGVGYLLRLYLGIQHWLGAFSLFCLGTALWGFLVRGAVRRLGIAPEARVPRLVGFVARTAAIIVLGAAGSVLGGFVIAQLVK